MIASEIMMESPVLLHPGGTVADAIGQAATSTLDVIPLVDADGRYVGAVSKAALVNSAAEPSRRIEEVCCADALICAPDDPLENLHHDSSTAVSHQTVMVVDTSGRFQGVVPSVHWAVDEAKVQSGHPRSPLEVRTYSMHLIYKCLHCGYLVQRNAGAPVACPHCGAGSTEFALYTED